MTAVTDFLGTPLEVGATVVYPATSGRSTQMVEAVVVELGEVKLPPLRDAGLQSVRVKPTGRTSRYRQHYSQRVDTEQNPVTLTANARSVVVLKRPSPLPGWHHVPNGHPDWCG